MDALRALPRGLCAARPTTRWPRASRSRASGSARSTCSRAYRDGSDLEARGNMLVAAAMGATAFQKGLGAIHALSHPVGALYDTHHGLTNAVFMPYVLDFNREALWDKFDRLAGWLGIEGGFSRLSRLRPAPAPRPRHPAHPRPDRRRRRAASPRWRRWRWSTRPPAATRGR